ncbi:MAG: HEAT repeat domain-containing protein [Candidatus Aminicenantes bacterium]|nr:HEAT repeat domain-containing protein [Candidatus Aminicenantes bacterium]
MNCQEAKRRMPDLLQDGLSGEEGRRLREHLNACPACWREWQELHETWTRLGLLPEAQPSPELRRGFYRLLEAGRHETSAAGRWRRWIPDLRLIPPAMRLAAALLVVVIGFGAGFLAGGRKHGDPEAITRLRGEVSRLQHQASLSLLSQSSAAARLQGLSLTTRLQDPDQRLLQRLLDILDNDPSVNVRLSAVDALYLFAEHEEVRSALAASLARQTSPLVQIALIDLMVSLKEKRAASALRKLLADEEAVAEVRQRARSGIEQIL